VPAKAHWTRLTGIKKHIASLGKLDSPTAQREFRRVFSVDSHLAHVWHEYEESLHEQEGVKEGQRVVIDVRATVPAAMYFNPQSIVDGRVNAEFFKHAPGLFTGIGIIGTFTGLISGLGSFKVSGDPEAVRHSLELLMHVVGEAFVVSAVAISCAMAVTFLEKLLLARLYAITDEIVLDIDASFDAGVGEEYLSRLVDSSEQSATHAKILKDSIVQELGEILRDLTEAQIAASREQQTALIEATRQDSQTLGTTIAESIRESLERPLQDIAGVVKSASGDQSASASRVLQDVMASFSQRLNDLFGGQISGLTELNQQTAQSIREAVGTLQTLVANIEDSSRRSTETMAERMAGAIEKMEARQESMNAQTAAFVEQIRELVSSSQSETNQKLQATLATIGTEIGDMLGRLGESQRQVFESNHEREREMATRSAQAVSQMSGSVESIIGELNQVMQTVSTSVNALTETTTSSVTKMMAGADQLGAASRNFAIAGERVAGVMDTASSVTTKLVETSGHLTSGSHAVQELLRDYRAQRDALEVMMEQVSQVIEATRAEASLTGDILRRIEGSATLLASAQEQANDYLQGVNQVLGEAHASFATEVKRTLDKANLEFHDKLSSAVGLLSSGIGELEIALASMGNLRPVRSKAA
jgi:ABC-type transporter Mla subunit MlaD